MNIETIQPLGDLVLVRRLPDADSVHGILIPESARNKKRGDDNDIHGSLRRGIVVALGPGDKLLQFKCPDCGEVAGATMRPESARSATLVPRTPNKKCGCGVSTKWQFATGEPEVYCEMEPAIGNEVIFERWGSSQFDIDGVEYSLIHEEQSILGVIER
jgi:co-chaperonin GroES (HSP10)